MRVIESQISDVAGIVVIIKGFVQRGIVDVEIFHSSEHVIEKEQVI